MSILTSSKPPKLTNTATRIVELLRAQGPHTPQAIAEKLKCGRGTVYRNLPRLRVCGLAVERRSDLVPHVAGRPAFLWYATEDFSTQRT